MDKSTELLHDILLLMHQDRANKLINSSPLTQDFIDQLKREIKIEYLETEAEILRVINAK